VASVKRCLQGLTQSLAAGHTSTALVIAQELTALLDTPTSANPQQNTSKVEPSQLTFPSSNSLVLSVVATQQQSGPGTGVVHADVPLLLTKLGSARQAGLGLTSKVKTVESLLRGLQQALPAWLQLTRAQVCVYVHSVRLTWAGTVQDCVE
jgi:hypothetical protein